MNFIQVCFEERVCDYTECLDDIGFSRDQTFRFLPEAATGVLDVTQNTSIFQAITCLLDNRSSQLLRMLDVDLIADRSGVSSEQVIAGFNAISPLLLEDFFHKGQSFIRSGSRGLRKARALPP
ncbi:MAG TPA: hypothetical protein ENJ87_11855 [Gammaproteobacteria bacterium]|nr:hypothetical protein [Gammaproteobacteria bacterium]